MNAPSLNDTLWSFTAALLLIILGVVGGLMEAMVDFTPIIHLWVQHPYMIGNGGILIFTVISVCRYVDQNSRDPESPENEYGLDFVFSVGTRVGLGVMIGVIYSIVVYMLQRH
ncbi:MAG: hypothetical protein RLY57_473 [Candidatus Parcubacteria bacterium]|jgi:hypothetical protein